MGGVVVNDHSPPSWWVTRPFATTVQAGSAVTVSPIVALRSGWSKHGKTRWATSMPRYAETYRSPSAGSVKVYIPSPSVT